MKKAAPKAYAWAAERLAKLGIRLNSLGAGTVVALGAMGRKNELEAAEAPGEQDSQPNSLGHIGPLSGPSVPFGPAGEATKVGTYSLNELKKALSRRGLYFQAPRKKEVRDLVRALVDLDRRQNPNSMVVRGDGP